MTFLGVSLASIHLQPAEDSLMICFLEEKKIDDSSENQQVVVKVTPATVSFWLCPTEKHHINLSDGRAVYLDHAQLRLPALHLC